MQSSRAIVVTGQKSKDMWQMIADSYVKLTGGDGEFARLGPELRCPTHVSLPLWGPKPLWRVPNLNALPHEPIPSLVGPLDPCTCRPADDQPRPKRETVTALPLSQLVTELSCSSRTTPSLTAGSATCQRSPRHSLSGRCTKQVCSSTSSGPRSRRRVWVLLFK